MLANGMEYYGAWMECPLCGCQGPELSWLRRASLELCLCVSPPPGRDVIAGGDEFDV